jgi:thymidylate synthase
MKVYLDIVKDVLENGTLKKNRTGVDTLSKFGIFYKIDLNKGFPLLTTKKISWKNILIETLWFLSGSSSSKFLHKHNIHFWDPWLDGTTLPKAYGEYWRNYPKINDSIYGNDIKVVSFFDQVASIIHEIKNNPNSRRMFLTNWYAPSAWQSKLPPCHYGCLFNVQNDKLNIQMYQRSCDICLGLPYNIASYSLLLHLFAHLTNYQVGEFNHCVGDYHIYVNHIDKVKKQINRQTLSLSTLIIDSRIKTLNDVDELIQDGSTKQILDTFRISNYKCHPAIKFDVAV